MSGASCRSSPPGKKPFVRQSAAQTIAGDMGAMGALSYLKTEAAAMQRAGIKGLLDNDCAALTPILSPYLSGTAAKAHSDAVGVEHEEHNRNAFKALPDKYTNALDTTGTVALQFDKEHALNVYCKLIENLKTGSDADDGVPEFYIDSVGGKDIKKKSGGFQKLYDPINVPRPLVTKAEQDRCIFAMKPGDFGKVGGSYAKSMMNDALKHVQDLYPAKTTISLKVVHILFHWNAHSFFTYHTDEDGKVTVIINLAHCKADMHVAGSGNASYDGIGSARLFPSNVYHRSGTAPRRCIKVALFYEVGFDVQEIDDCEEDEVYEGKGNVKEAQPNQEVKAEAAASSTTEAAAASATEAAAASTTEAPGSSTKRPTRVKRERA